VACPITTLNSVAAARCAAAGGAHRRSTLAVQAGRQTGRAGRLVGTESSRRDRAFESDPGARRCCSGVRACHWQSLWVTGSRATKAMRGAARPPVPTGAVAGAAWAASATASAEAGAGAGAAAGSAALRSPGFVVFDERLAAPQARQEQVGQAPVAKQQPKALDEVSPSFKKRRAVSAHCLKCAGCLKSLPTCLFFSRPVPLLVPFLLSRLTV
jgi:hypothetical protein